jgi:hypothetical protein
MKGSARGAIMKQDLFGHVVTFNLDQKGNVHYSMIGGVFSIILKVLMAIYVLIRVNKLVYRQDPTTTTTDALLKVDLHGEVPIDTMKFSPFFIISKQLRDKLVLVDDVELARYLDIYFEYWAVDWYKPKYDGRYTKTRIKAKRCEATDFGPS